MRQIQQITTAPLQKQSITLDDGSFVALTLYFRPMQYGWFIEEMVYGARTFRGLRVCNSPDMLFQWRNLLPFGIACFSDGGREPQLQQDFATGASKLYLLSRDEVTQYVEFLNT